MREAILMMAATIVCCAMMQASNEEVSGKDTVFRMSTVLVTATQATERVTPVTFTDLNRAQLRQRYSTQDVPVLLSELPSVTYYSENGNGIGYNYINIRGFDQRRLSVMVNGVPQNDPEDHNVYWIDFPDLLASTGNIQVQRGAGSAFYGPPAIGGSVNLVTNPFTPTPSITLETDFGFQEFKATNSTPLNTKKFAASLNSGLVENAYMFFGRFGKIQSDGYRNNSWVDLNSYFLGAVRFDESVTTRIHIFGGPFTDGLSFYGLPKFTQHNPVLRLQNLTDWGVDSTGKSYDYTTPRRTQEAESFSQPHYEVLNEWKISKSVTLSNTLFYYTGDGYFDYDASWADTSMLRIGTAYGIPANGNPTNTLVRGFVGNKQWGWLPHLEIIQQNGSLTVGAELRIHRSTHWGKIEYAGNLPANLDPDYHFYEYNGEKDILSAYAHEIARLSSGMTMMADLQVVRNRYGVANEKYLEHNFSLPYLFVNPRIGLNDNINEEWNTYVSLAYTSREPRLRNLYAAEDSYFGALPQFKADTSGGVVTYDFTQPLAKPERLFDAEAGCGFRSAEARFSANVFWMEFSDELVQNGKVDIFGQPVTGNAERTRHIGIEFDGSLAIENNFLLSGNCTLSRNRLIRYSVVENGRDTSLNGNPIAGFPEFLFNLRLTYQNDPLIASLLSKYVGPFYTDNFKNPANQNDAYTIFNLEMTYTLPPFWRTALSLRAEIRNLFDKLYFSNGEGNAFFPAAERNYLVGITAQL